MKPKSNCKICTSKTEVDEQNQDGKPFGERQMYDATCSNCGKPAKVPFPPKEDRPVYCAECWPQFKAKRDSRV